MSIKNEKFLVALGLGLWIVPELLYSPIIQIYFNIVTNGGVFRQNFFSQASVGYIYLILLLQLIGLIILSKFIKIKLLKIIFLILAAITILTLIVVQGFSNFGF